MKDPIDYLQCARLPGRVPAAAVATLLGFREHDIATLVSRRLLKPLGDAIPYAARYFATKDILELADDPQWQNKATKAIAEHWRRHNKAKPPASAA